MLDTIRGLIARDPDYPQRAWDLEIRRRALKGTLYDALGHPFHEERDGSGAHIPLSQRRPSVRFGLCRVVVRDSIALLFGEGRFPAIDSSIDAERELLVDLAADTQLALHMTEAAWRGAVGTVALRMRVLAGRLFVDSLDAGWLTPEYEPAAPDVLLRVVELRKSRGAELAAAGYDGLDPGTTYWFRREWTQIEEAWFAPLSVADRSEGKPFLPDPARTVRHNLGFVPIVWVRNLPFGDDPDGGTTIPDEVIRTGIEIDYLLSQGGRGLKYSQDPTLLIKEPATPMGAEFVKSADNALVLSENGDAKLLEIGGTASAAVLEWCKGLREFALETAHGNRSNVDKLSAAQSGRAMELMHQPLIWLADDLRTSYGTALLELLRMIAAASQKYPLALRDGTKVKLDPAARRTLRWPPWFEATHEDLAAEANTLVALTGGGLMSRESGVKETAESYDIGDVSKELLAIRMDQAEADARLKAQAAQIQAREPVGD
jgi:hypothetical protein